MDDNSDSNSDSEINFEKNTDKFYINIFGITAEGYSVSIKVEDFEPYFYIYLPEITKQKDLDQFIHLKNCLPKKYSQNSISSYGLIKEKNLLVLIQN